MLGLIPVGTSLVGDRGRIAGPSGDGPARPGGSSPERFLAPQRAASPAPGAKNSSSAASSAGAAGAGSLAGGVAEVGSTGAGAAGTAAAPWTVSSSASSLACFFRQLLRLLSA